MSTLRIALVQTATHWHDPAANRARFDQWLDSVSPDVHLVVLPEMFSTGFTMASEAVAESMDGPTMAWMRARAARGGAALAGSLVIADGLHRYNRFVCVGAGGPAVVYDKVHRFRMADEHRYYAAGTRRTVFPIAGFRVCPMICYDLRFPVFFRSRGDYDLLLCVANWPAARAGAWRTLLQARAIENQCYVVGVNILGRDGNGVDYAGGSLVAGPDGELLCDAGGEAGVYDVALDLDALERYRAAFPVWRDADPFMLTGQDEGTSV